MVFSSSPRPADLPYRPNVGILLLNVYGLIWVGERIDLPGAWQMPQGGIEPGETLEDAFFREAEEEVGLTRDKLRVVAVAREVWRYDFPPHVMRRQPTNTYKGQEQRWVAARFLGRDQDIVTATPEPEFSAWHWVTPDQLMDLIVPFKRGTYRRVLREFRALLPDG